MLLAETLVADHEARLGVVAGDEYAERGQMHRIGGAHPRVVRIGIADELRRQWIEERFARRSLNMLVHGDLDWFPHRGAYCIAATGRPRRPISNSIHCCIELHFDLKWQDVKSPNQADPGRYA